MPGTPMWACLSLSLAQTPALNSGQQAGGGALPTPRNPRWTYPTHTFQNLTSNLWRRGEKESHPQFTPYPAPTALSGISVPDPCPHHLIPTSDALCAHLGPAEKGIKARGDLFWGVSGLKRKGLYTWGQREAGLLSGVSQDTQTILEKTDVDIVEGECLTSPIRTPPPCRVVGWRRDRNSTLGSGQIDGL